MNIKKGFILCICLLIMSSYVDAQDATSRGETLNYLKRILQGKMRYYVSGNHFTTWYSVNNNEIVISDVSLDWDILQIKGTYSINGV
jgi:hypothetical protein